MRVTESAAELSSETAAPEPRVEQGSTVTELEWNDAENKVSKLVEAVGTPARRETAYEYLGGGSGALARRVVSDPDESHETAFDYYTDREGGFIADVKEIDLPGGRTWTFEVDVKGNTFKTTDPNGVAALTEYSPTTGVVTREQDLMGRWTTFAAHDLGGQPTKVTLPSGDSTVPRAWTYEYDARGDVTKVIDPRGDASRSGASDPYVTTLTYDAFGRLFRERIPRLSGDATAAPAEGPAFAQRTRYFDRDGAVERVVDPRNLTTTIDYDAMDQPVAVHAPGSKATETTRYVYDDAERLIAQARPAGAASVDPNAIRAEHLAACEARGAQGSRAYLTRHCLDHRGRPMASASYSTRAGDIAARVAAFAYDGRGNVLGQVDPNRNTTPGPNGTQLPVTIDEAIEGRETVSRQRMSYVYDALDRRREEVERPTEDPTKIRKRTLDYAANGDLQGTREEGPGDPRITSAEYDPAGRVLWQADAKGRATCFRRRPDGRVESVTSPRGTEGSTLADCRNPGHAYSTHTTRFEYDEAGDVTRRTIPHADDQYGGGLGVNGWDVDYQRDVVGNPTRITDARNHEISNRFYDSGELRSTDRPSWWQLDWPGDEGNPRGGQRYQGNDTADVEVAEGGPVVREREGRTANAEGSAELAQKPESLGKTDFGDVPRAEVPDLLPQAGDTNLRYDEQMRLSVVQDAAGKERQISYDPAGRVLRKSWPLDASARIEHAFAYDPNGNLEAVTEDWREGDPVVTTFGYDGYDRRVEEDAEGAHATDRDALTPVREVTGFAYDANDNLVRRTTAEGTRFEYRYSSLDDLVSEANPVPEEWTYAYNQFGELDKEVAPHRAADPASLYTANRKYDVAGQLEEITRPVDEPGQADPTELKWSFTYDADGNRDKTEAPGAPDRVTTEVDHDGRGLPWRTTVSGGGSERVSIVEHDANGNLRRTVNPAGIGANGLPKNLDDGTADPANLESASEDATVRVYDDDDLVESERMPWRDTESSTDKRYERVWERDSARGWVTAIRLPREVGSSTVWRTRYKHNDAGWITESSDVTKDPTGPLEARVRYSWDEQGNQVKWRSEHAGADTGRDIRFTYWPNGLLRKRSAVKTLDKEGGTDDPTPNTRRTYDYLYNRNRSLVRAIDEDARRDVSGAQVRTTIFGRDAAEREIRVNEAWTGGRDVRLAYADGTGDLASRRTEGTFTGDVYGGDKVKTASFEYDSLGREVQMTVDPAVGADRVTKTRWHGGGQMRERTKPNGTVDRWSWNGLGEKTGHERDPDTGTTQTQDYSYDDNGNRTKDERGEHRFNARDQLTWWKRASDSGHADRRGWTTSYTLGGSGEMTDKVERDEGGVVRLDHDFLYDGDRLTKVTTLDKTQPAEVTTRQTYRYDDAGNVQRVYTQTLADLPVVTPTPGSTALSPVECDKADVTVSKSITRYCYDEFNRQVFSSGSGVANPAYVSYDGLDRRDRKAVKDPTGADTEVRDYAYIGSSELLVSESVNPTGGSSKRHSYDYDSQGDRQGQQTDTGAVSGYRTYAKDANGSVVGLESSMGTVATGERYDYDPYGELDRKPPAGAEEPDAGLSTEAKANPFRFQGFYYDSGVKTYDMHARHYRPDTGRFLSRDIYASAAGDQALQADPLTQNRYAFAGANPVTNIEFDGHMIRVDAAPDGSHVKTVRKFNSGRARAAALGPGVAHGRYAEWRARVEVREQLVVRATQSAPLALQLLAPVAQLTVEPPRAPGETGDEANPNYLAGAALAASAAHTALDEYARVGTAQTRRDYRRLLRRLAVIDTNSLLAYPNLATAGLADAKRRLRGNRSRSRRFARWGRFSSRVLGPAAAGLEYKASRSAGESRGKAAARTVGATAVGIAIGSGAATFCAPTVILAAGCGAVGGVAGGWLGHHVGGAAYDTASWSRRVLPHWKP